MCFFDGTKNLSFALHEIVKTFIRYAEMFMIETCLLCVNENWPNEVNKLKDRSSHIEYTNYTVDLKQTVALRWKTLNSSISYKLYRVYITHELQGTS